MHNDGVIFILSLTSSYKSDFLILKYYTFCFKVDSCLSSNMSQRNKKKRSPNNIHSQSRNAYFSVSGNQQTTHIWKVNLNSQQKDLQSNKLNSSECGPTCYRASSTMYEHIIHAMPKHVTFSIQILRFWEEKRFMT